MKKERFSKEFVSKVMKLRQKGWKVIILYPNV